MKINKTDKAERLCKLQTKIHKGLEKGLGEILRNNKGNDYTTGDFYTILLQMVTDSIRGDALKVQLDTYNAAYNANRFIIDIIQRSEENWINEVKSHN